MERLIDGIHRFQSVDFRPLQGLFEQLAHGQRPETLFITCSDSRIDPTLITRAQPGELFILRNAGNIVPPHGASNGGELATIEYAVAALGVTEVIVCGHSHCGAMKALLAPETLADLPAMRAWLSHAETTRRIVQENYGHLSGEALINAAIEENVLVQLENLETLPTVASRIRRGDLHLHAWVYEIESGAVFAYDAAAGQFATVAEVHAPNLQTAARRREGDI